MGKRLSVSNSVFYPMTQATNIFVNFGVANSVQDTGIVYSSLISNLDACVTVTFADRAETLSRTASASPSSNAYVVASNEVLITLSVDQGAASLPPTPSSSVAPTSMGICRDLVRRFPVNVTVGKQLQVAIQHLDQLVCPLDWAKSMAR